MSIIKNRETDVSLCKPLVITSVLAFGRGLKALLRTGRSFSDCFFSITSSIRYIANNAHALNNCFTENKMNIQIFGTKKCRDTQKALRYFKERGTQPHFVDLAQKAMSRGELQNVKRSVPLENLIDRDCKAYTDRGLAHIRHDIEETILDDPRLIKTPVVRFGSHASVGYTPDLWETWRAGEDK
jgi:arsenate reductase-like glutaredoxin family protein